MLKPWEFYGIFAMLALYTVLCASLIFAAPDSPFTWQQLFQLCFTIVYDASWALLLYHVRKRHLLRVASACATAAMLLASDMIWKCGAITIFLKFFAMLGSLLGVTSVRKLQGKLSGNHKVSTPFYHRIALLSTTGTFVLAFAFPASLVIQVLELCHVTFLWCGGVYYICQYMRTSAYIFKGAIQVQAVRRSKIEKIKVAKKNLAVNLLIVTFVAVLVVFLVQVLQSNVWSANKTSMCSRRDMGDNGVVVQLRFAIYAVGIFFASAAAWHSTVIFTGDARRKKKRLKQSVAGVPVNGKESVISTAEPSTAMQL